MAALPTPQPVKRWRRIIEKAWCTVGMKGLEAVTETCGDTTSLYYQVVREGKEILQTIDRDEAKRYYDGLN